MKITKYDNIFSTTITQRKNKENADEEEYHKLNLPYPRTLTRRLSLSLSLPASASHRSPFHLFSYPPSTFPLHPHPPAPHTKLSRNFQGETTVTEEQQEFKFLARRIYDEDVTQRA